MSTLEFTTEQILTISLVDSGIGVGEHGVETPHTAHGTSEKDDTHDRVSLINKETKRILLYDQKDTNIFINTYSWVTQPGFLEGLWLEGFRLGLGTHVSDSHTVAIEK